jgi:hypothetical protein
VRAESRAASSDGGAASDLRPLVHAELNQNAVVE